MPKLLLSILLGILLFSYFPIQAQVILDNGQATLHIEKQGGAFSYFSLAGSDLNPLSWALTTAQMPKNNQSGAPFKGHFLCLGRWGSPSTGEIEAGIPHNGEPSRDYWDIHRQSKQHVEMSANAPLDGFKVSRTVTMESGSKLFHVSETIHNVSSMGRISNHVQHPTLGPPFLQPETRINSNAGAGFLQSMSYPNPHTFEYRWPNGIQDSSRTPLDLEATDGTFNYVSTHIFDEGEKTGWIVAYTPKHKLLYGLVWDIEAYPWLNVWHYSVDGKPVAKGLELGTAGIGRPYKELLETDTRFHEKNSWIYIDAGETQTRSFSCFLLEIPEDFAGIKDIEWEDKQLKITDRKGGNHFLSAEAKAY